MISLNNKLKEELARDVNWYTLLLPKLEAIKNGGSGTTIHDAILHIAILNNYLILIDKYPIEPRWINHLSDYLDKTEKWLIDIAYKGVNNNE